MSKCLTIFRFLTALAALILLGYLAWQCLDMYMTGADSTLDAIFTYKEVSLRLKQLVTPTIILILLSLSTWLMSKTRFPVNGSQRVKYAHQEACRAAELPAVRRDFLQWVILLAGAALVLWGIANGSLYDVLVKSINICTECIGLG